MFWGLNCRFLFWKKCWAYLLLSFPSLQPTLSSGESCAFSVISSSLCPWLQRNQCNFKSRAPSSWWTRRIKLTIKQAADKADTLSSQKQIQIGLLILFICRNISGAEILFLLKLGNFTVHWVWFPSLCCFFIPLCCSVLLLLLNSPFSFEPFTQWENCQ